MWSVLRRICDHYGYLPPRKSRGVLIYARSHANYLNPLIEALRQRYPRLNLYWFGEAPPSLSDAVVQLHSLANRAAVQQRFLRRTKTHALFVTPNCDIEPGLIQIAKTQDITIIMIGGSADGISWLKLVDYFIIFDAVDAERLLARGISAQRIMRSPPYGKTSVHRIIDQLEGEIIRERRSGKNQRWREKLGSRLFLQGPLAPLTKQKYQCIETLEELRQVLHSPLTILCLGNGPSSEDPRVIQTHYEALFRVNHSWLSRGLFKRADVVFTGLRSTVKAHPRPTVFVFQTLTAEYRMKLKCLMVPGKIHYATAERLGTLNSDAFGIYQPTNGAVMLATAVALQPQKLVIAGMDLFKHPAGSYPGENSTPNAYTLSHDRQTELEFILATLRQFKGELEIIGTVLEAEWKAYKTTNIDSHPTREGHFKTQ